MKIGILTCNRANNYGARLQAYALWRHLTELGHDASVIDYSPPYFDFNVRRFYNPGTNVKEWVKIPVRYSERCRCIAKFKHLEEFSASMTRLTPVRYTSIEELRDNPPQADLYIAGSDQIWNTRLANGHDPAFYLDFGDMLTRRISYAASFATEKIEEGLTDFVSRNLGRLDAVSVREESGKNIAARFGIDAELCCDPAFLLERSAWEEICEGQSPVEPFLLVYDFEGSPCIKAVAKKLSRARGLKVCAISNVRLGYADRDYSDCQPSDFIRLIKDADCVVSNSLHGTIFSIIFGKDFLVADRSDGLNIRMHDLLKRYHLNNRLVTPDSNLDRLLSPIDYSEVRHHLNADIARSKEWLSHNLKSKK